MKWIDFSHWAQIFTSCRFWGDLQGNAWSKLPDLRLVALQQPIHRHRTLWDIVIWKWAWSLCRPPWGLPMIHLSNSDIEWIGLCHFVERLIFSDHLLPIYAIHLEVDYFIYLPIALNRKVVPKIGIKWNNDIEKECCIILIHSSYPVVHPMPFLVEENCHENN